MGRHTGTWQDERVSIQGMEWHLHNHSFRGFPSVLLQLRTGELRYSLVLDTPAVPGLWEMVDFFFTQAKEAPPLQSEVIYFEEQAENDDFDFPPNCCCVECL